MAEIYRSDIVRVDLDHALLRKHVGAILVTGDKLGNRFGAEVFRDGNPVDVTGCGVTAYFLRPGEDAIVLNGTASGSVAYVDLAQACYSKASSFTLTIKISYGGSTTALRVIDGYILLTQTDDLVDPGEVVPTLDDIFAQIATMEAATERAQTATADAIAAKDNANGAAVNAVNIATEKGDQAIQLAQEEADKQNVKIAALTEDIARNTAPAIIPTATGSIVTITDGAARPAVEVISHIEPVQEGSGDPSPDNVRPISGWNSVSAWAAGANLYNPDTATKGYALSSNGGTYVSASSLTTDYIPVKSGQRIVIGWSELRWGCFYTDEDANSYIASFGNSEVSVPNNCRYIRVTAPIGDEKTLSVCYANVPANGAAYQPIKALTADLPEVVYGADMHWNTGGLTETYDILTITGNNDYTFNAAGIILVQSHHSTSISGIGLISSHYNAGGYASKDNYVYPANDITFVLRDLEHFATAESAATYLKAQYAAGTPVQIAYKLATPKELQLTPQQISTLHGMNNVWSDCGETTLSYIADTKSYIDQKLAAIAAATL